MSATAYLGLGGNVGDVTARLGEAVGLLAAHPQIAVTGRSSLWRTPPWGDVNQPPFLNACVALRTTLAPEALLDVCLATERRLGRDRDAPDARRWGPRPIDIDVLDYDGVRVDAARLTLPHPRLGERAFALAPLCELAAELPVYVPGATAAGGAALMPAREALALADQQGLERLDGAW